MHCILQCNVFDGSWWKWGERKLQEGGMSPILTLDLGDRSHFIGLNSY